MRSIQISEASCISPFKNAHSAFHARPRVIVSPSLCERRRLLNTITPHVAHPARQRGGLQVVAAIKKSTGKQVACNKTLVALQGKEDAVDVLCKEVVAFTRERQTDRKAGILTFECSKDPFESNVFHFWEVYNSNLSMGQHNSAPEVVKFMEQVQLLLERPVGMILYEMKDGKLGAAAVQGGPKGEGGLDDATGASGAAGGASYKQTSATVDLTKVKDDEEEDNKIFMGIKFELPWFGKKKE